MASSSTGSSSQKVITTEYVVRVPKSSRKRYNMMRFNADLGQDFFKSWSNCKLERENNFKEYTQEDMPKYGAGSEFGKELREEARRKRIGINIKKYKAEDQPWVLSTGHSSNKKKFKGIREGGVSDHTSWYVFMQGKDGYFEAYPVEEWYNFQPINRYKYLSAEEAEAEFEKRGKIMNYFQVMYEKRYKKGGEEEDDDEGKKSKSKKLKLSEMDEWVDDDDEEELGSDEDDENPKKKGKGKRKSRRGGKKRSDVDDDCMEESDDYDEGAEHDYISGDSSDSDQENDEKVIKDLAGVEEGEALKKLLESDDEDEEAKSSESDDEGEDKDNKDKKKKKKQKNDADSDGSSEVSSDDGKKKEEESTVNKLKRKMLETPDKPDSKRMKLSQPGSTTPGVDNPVTEEAIRRYLMRKPMTTTDLLQKFKTKKTGLNSEQLVQAIANLLKKINPSKQTVKGKMYLSIKS